MKGVDYSWSRPGGAAIKAAGFGFVIRYVPYVGDDNKGLRVDELEDLRANGLAIALVWETTPGRALEGREAGAFDATIAAANAASLGFPLELPIYFAVDVDTSPSQLAAVDAYLIGCASVIGAHRVGVYGEHDVIEHCHAAGTAAWLWQTYAWSLGEISAHAHIHQYLNGQTLNGSAVDYNEALQDDFGQWETEEDMSTTDDILLALFAGSEERDPDTGETLSRERRLAAAKFRVSQAADGRAQSVAEQAASASVAIGLHIANHTQPGGKVADHTHEGGAVKR